MTLPPLSIRLHRDAIRPVAVLVSLCSLWIAGCTEPAPPPQSMASTAPYEVVTVQSIELADERWIDGRVEGLQQATITAQVPGQVSAILRDAEADVVAGEAVLRVRATQVQGGLAQAEAAVREAEAFAADAEARYQRIDALYQRKVVPRATYDQALAQRESALARQQSARAGRDAAIAYTVVSAPFTGVVTERFVRVGDSVAPGTPLFGVAATGGWRIRAELPQSLVGVARELRTVVVHHQGERLKTEDVRIYAGADLRDGSFGLQADLLTPVVGLAPGMVVKLGIVAGRRAALRIPRTAVIERGEVTGVYVYSPAGTRFRQVRLGAVSQDEVEVLAGLTVDEQVARRSAEALAVLRVAAEGAR